MITKNNAHRLVMIKQSLYFPKEMFDEIRTEAGRLDRKLSWMAQKAWKVAREEIKKLPSSEPNYKV